jgi:hypothetical protein
MRNADTGTEIFFRLNEIPLSKSDRRYADAYLQEGEYIAELFSGASTSVAHAFGSIGHGVKAVFAKPVRH